MQTAIGVRFKKLGRIQYYRPGVSDVEKGDWVIAETQRGLECGQVVMGPGDIVADAMQLRCIRRRATPNDLIKHENNRKHEAEAFLICKEKIAEHKLPMKLISVEFTFDVNKIIFSFTSEGRVDFRELVRDLAYVFRTRIELRQVGVRDETKVMGGIGNCGRPLCCASFLGDFAAVSIRMAKEQNLSLNPTKISGCCGRLMCCLQYEDENYHGKGCLCRRESSINNLDAENDDAAAAKLEEMEIEEEKLEAEGSTVTRSERSDRSERSERRGGDGRRSFGSSRGVGDRSRSIGRHERDGRKRPEYDGSTLGARGVGRSTVGGAMSGTEQSGDVPKTDSTKRSAPNKKSRPKKSAYQRDKNFHSRRPNLDDV